EPMEDTCAAKWMNSFSTVAALMVPSCDIAAERSFTSSSVNCSQMALPCSCPSASMKVAAFSIPLMRLISARSTALTVQILSVHPLADNGDGLARVALDHIAHFLQRRCFQAALDL